MITADSAQHSLIKPWLIVCMVCVVTMVLIGGITRLTESGLSIVEWKLFTGILPPMNEQAWEGALEEYRSSPEYQQINKGMNVEEFKQIYWLEYLHRLMGRITGLVFIIPFAFFALSKKMNSPLIKRMGMCCVLVAAQGAVGWIMVQSGLQDEPRVNPIKLALHLSLAFSLFCLLLWTWLQLHKPDYRNYQTAGRRAKLARLITIFVCIQIIFGAFVAGMDAGKIYNTYPLMDGDWVPAGLTMHEPFWANFIENTTTLQFQHRMMALLVAVSIILFILRYWGRCDESERNLLTLLGISLIIQFGLGVLTLVHMVPWHLASTHQMFALALLGFCITICYRFPLNKQEA
ncbi:MAG: COX15/CtaA family protein [Rickettsiales bacterium]|nr:COX15/CtaA family protein [Rickettsiales bacterium]